MSMSTLEEIKVAIAKLSPAERAELDLFLQQADDEWDRQMVADAQAGKLDRLLARVDANILAWQDDERWEELVESPQRRPKLDAFLRSISSR